MKAHGYRQGIAVLAFAVDNVEAIRDRYQQLHPELIADYEVYDDDVKVLEVFAYYSRHEPGETKRLADQGTILRFLQSAQAASECALPGLTMVHAEFEDSSQPAYCDHWVSNVFSRTEFLDTLKDTLGFTPKVDFNAGVVAAGEAQIESTVTGNDSVFMTSDKAEALRNQSQVFLPINNALSSVGHVHGFLEELGQGVQHVASRVENLVDFVQRGNDYRKITNEGFTFLRIPRSYYGILTLSDLTGIVGDGSDAVGEACAKAIMETLEAGMVLTKDGAVDLDISRDDLDVVLEKGLSDCELKQYRKRSEGLLDVILQSRYKNLYGLLGRRISEKTYLGIVRNQILVDIQGDDLLYQIFTCNILQRNTGDEAPFFEFIQRVCSECVDEDGFPLEARTGCPQTLRSGCGGFGIRNFLTLFLSIEVSKAMQEASDAMRAGKDEHQRYALAMVACFTDQLNESNPILTEISEAMTEEGRCKERMMKELARHELKEAALWKTRMDMAGDRKMQGNKKLMDCSARYNNLMKTMRESRVETQH
jgi:hypothetical protein